MTSARRQLAFFARLLALLGHEALELVDRDEPAVGGVVRYPSRRPRAMPTTTYPAQA